MSQSNNAVLAYKYEVDGEPVNLTMNTVQKYIVGESARITEQEFVMFASLCKARKLNPFVKDAYLIKYGNNAAQMVVGKDAILKRAVTHPEYDGKESGIVIRNESGEIEERKGCFYDPSAEKLLGGWARVYRKDWQHPEYASVALSEVAQKTKDGKFNSNWAYKTATMVEKVAKVRALREAFVEEFGGMYVEDELQDVVSEAPETKPVQQDPFNEENVVEAEIQPKAPEGDSIDLSDL